MSFPRRSLTLALVVLVLGASACALPDLREERAKAPALPQTSFLYAADGTTLITKLHDEQNRVVVGSSRIPDVVRNAVVAIEDQRFWIHRGIDLKAVLRAAYVNATEGRIVEGGSTITQQYVKNVFVGDEETLERKIKEAYLAWELEDRLSKEQILTKYLNTVYFGNGAYGIEAAAEVYFDEDASALTLSQSAVLAGLIRSPAQYDPVSRPKAARNRRDRVLDAMLEQGLIEQRDWERATQRRIRLNPPEEDDRQYVAPHFVDYLKEWFLSNPRFGETVEERKTLLFEGGLRITTTLVPRFQEYAEDAVASVLTEPGDPYAAMTVIDPRTGYVKAMVGGRDYWNEKDRFARLNLATGGSTGRQAGSSYKVYALVAALENGLSPQTTLNGSSASIPLSDGTVYHPENYEGASYGSLSLESATVNSVNIAYVNLLSELGDGDPWKGAEIMNETAERMGIRCCPRTTEPSTPLANVPSAVLGTNEVSTLEMASGYGTLATGGAHAQPTPVVRITSADGTVLYEAGARPKQVVAPAVASVAVDVLKKVVLYGTGTYANIGRPQFGKTGTAQEWRDAWFVGAIPQLVTAVWVGYPQGQISMQSTRIGRVTGGTWPAQIWRAFMVNATERMKVLDFPETDVQFVTLRIDVTQGCLANPYTLPMNIQSQTFIAGTEPKLKTCKEPSSYQMLTVPSVIGLKEGAATSLLQGNGFSVDVVYEASDQPPGTVVAQDPSAGERAQQTSTVTITVSEERATETEVPNVVGMTEGSASATLRGLGFEVQVVAEPQCEPTDPSCDYRQGRVWRQEPGAGASAPPGSTVTIFVNP